MRIEIRKKDQTVIEIDCEAIHIELEPIHLSHEFFRLKDDDKTLKLFYHGLFADDVSKVFEYEAGSGVLCKDEQARYAITKERGVSKIESKHEAEYGEMMIERKASVNQKDTHQKEKKP